MKFKYYNSTIPYIKIEDVFSKDINQKIIKEAIKNKNTFKEALISDKNIPNPKVRNNTVSFYDELYLNNRNESVLLKSLDLLFSDINFRSVLSSSTYPFNLFPFTNTHETQVSRYGDSKQKYDWHIDRFDSEQRIITFVYYFNETPKKYKGGEILLTDSPLVGQKPINSKPNILKIKPKNNMGIIFSSTTPHCVSPTTSPIEFSKGRFSVNCWIGVNG